MGLVGLCVLGCAQAPRGAVRPRLGRTQALLVAGARDQLTWGTRYEPAYVKIAYPGGDPPRTQGVCTDVVVRAYRNAGFDLQKLIHEDMKAAWGAYPRYADKKAPDSNIDHRRVPNQKAYFKRHALSLTLKCDSPKDWQPGDIVEWKLVNGRDHTGILTDKLDGDGYPYAIHNIGDGPQEEDVLRTWTWKIVGHFRYPRR